MNQPRLQILSLHLTPPWQPLNHPLLLQFQHSHQRPQLQQTTQKLFKIKPSQLTPTMSQDMQHFPPQDRTYLHAPHNTTTTPVHLAECPFHAPIYSSKCSKKTFTLECLAKNLQANTPNDTSDPTNARSSTANITPKDSLYAKTSIATGSPATSSTFRLQRQDSSAHIMAAATLWRGFSGKTISTGMFVTHTPNTFNLSSRQGGPNLR